MAKIGIIRCEKNEHKCPLTNCLKSLAEGGQGFAVHQGPNTLVGVFTCRCPGDQAVNLGKILKSKGAEVIHWCTCLFAHKEEGRWLAGDGFCQDVDSLIQRVAREAEITCVKGTAHLPQGYQPEVSGQDTAMRES
ncbi:MAG TPA: CGGC domain-containing protein [Desulfonatronum sp.]|nr:CGGC domain-containing protein [Desulfonatronum sp.]